MKKILKLLACLALAGVVSVVGLSALSGRDAVMQALLGPVERSAVSFASLSPPDTLNWYLVCPEGVCGASPQAASPVFEEPVAVLRDRWRRMVAAQPRTERLSDDDDALQEDYVQRSRIVGWPDTVTVRFIARDDARSTLAIYSRSHYGYSDMGVNRKRIEAWLAALAAMPAGQ